MRITRIDTYALECPLERPFGWSQGWICKRETMVVKVTTDAGIAGWGESPGRAVGGVIHSTLARQVLDQDALNRNALWQRMFGALYNANLTGGIGGTAISGIDIALWDIAGKVGGLPVCQLLGGAVRDKVAVYATGLYYTEGEFPDRLLAEARGYVDAGFKGMKTKVGGQSLEDDVQRVAALRKAIGPDVKLMVDANQAYNAATAIRIGRRLAEHDILWFEEPVSARDMSAYIEVKAALPMQIAGGECLRSRFEFCDFFTRRALDVAQPDVSLAGGISEMRAIATMANAFGIVVNPHVWGSPIMIAASLHVAATIPPCPTARQPRPFEQEPVMEFDRTPSDLRDKLCRQAFELVDGYVPVPDGPGLGIEVDEAVLERLCVDHQSTEAMA